MTFCFSLSVTIVGEYDGKKFEERDVMFSLGEGEDIGIIEGIEMALEKFNSGEKSKLIIKSQYAFKTAGKPEFNIPPNATVQYTVTLKNFEKVKFIDFISCTFFYRFLFFSFLFCHFLHCHGRFPLGSIAVCSRSPGENQASSAVQRESDELFQS